MMPSSPQLFLVWNEPGRRTLGLRLRRDLLIVLKAYKMSASRSSRDWIGELALTLRDHRTSSLLVVRSASGHELNGGCE